MLLTFSLPELAEKVISPSNIRTISSPQVMRITKYQLEDTMIQNQILLGGKGLIQVLQNRGKRKNDKKPIICSTWPLTVQKLAQKYY